MAIDFPSSPTLNQTFTSGGTTWIWNGTTWNLYLGGDIVTQSSLSNTLSGYQKQILYSASAPASPYDKQIYANSTDNSIYIYNEATTTWTSIGGSPDSDQTIIASRMFS